MPRITVNLAERSYAVSVERGAVDRVAELMPTGLRATKVLIVTDENVEPLYAGRVARSFERAGLAAEVFAVPAGESHKTLSTVERVYHAMVSAGLDRRSLVVAVGGGVVGDVAGFAAATYMRGVAFAQVPTTLLAQVDSSVGGKTGVDLPEGKNLVGAFHQPVAVAADPETLRTLPAREVRAGMAEVVKTAVIRDAAYFGFLERRAERLADIDALLAERDEALPGGDVASHLVARSVEIKAEVVSADEREGGLRAILNFGHTIGHALEAVTGYDRYLHGEAIAVGMAAAARISVLAGLAPEDVAARIVRLLEGIGLPTGGGGASIAAILDAMNRDKKAVGGRARFVLPRAIGEVGLFDDVDRDVVSKALRETGFSG